MMDIRLYDPVSIGMENTVHLMEHKCERHAHRDSDDPLCGEGVDRMLVPRIARGISLMYVLEARAAGAIEACKVCIEIAATRETIDALESSPEFSAADIIGDPTMWVER